LHYDFELWARDDQLPPEVSQGGDAWTVWLMLGGRGAGKTRAGAEWVRAVANAGDASPARIALVGETLVSARSVMVEGVSGLLAVHPPEARPLYEPSKRQVSWPNGAVAQLFSAEDPESLRGPQFSHAWCDELAKWRRPDESWAMLQFGLRLGDAPRQVVTTTPRPIKLIKTLLADPLSAVSRVATAANAVNLAPSFLDAIVGRYRGTRLGRQELDAELLEDRPDALFPRGLIERGRVAAAPELRRVVVAVDPPASSGPHADACGIVVAGLGEGGRAMCWPIAPWSMRVRSIGRAPRSAPIAITRPTASWPRPIKAAIWSRPSFVKSMHPCRCAPSAPCGASGCAPSRWPRCTSKAASPMSARSPRSRTRCAISAPTGCREGKVPTGSMRWSGR
jgi:phage terminase large subunit-like protein